MCNNSSAKSVKVGALDRILLTVHPVENVLVEVDRDSPWPPDVVTDQRPPVVAHQVGYFDLGAEVTVLAVVRPEQVPGRARNSRTYYRISSQYPVILNIRFYIFFRKIYFQLLNIRF